MDHLKLATTYVAQPSRNSGLFPVIRRAVHSVVQRGPSHAARWGWFHLNERFYEVLLDIDTVRDDEFNAESYLRYDDRVRYEPLPYTLINTILGRVTKRDVRDDVFLDYGCGMGRVVLMAARKPFKRVLGVELFDRLLTVAEQNVARAQPLLRSDITLLRADASRYVVPDDVSVIHLFNPFRGSVMAETQQRIRESLERRPRQLTVIYAHPQDQENLFENNGFVTLAERLPGGVLRGMNLLLYEHRHSSI